MYSQAVSVLSLAALWMPPGGDSLVFAPAEGTVLVKTFDRQLELKLDHYEFEFNSNRTLLFDSGPWIFTTRSERRHIVLEDRYLGRSAGQTTRLQRQYYEHTGSRVDHDTIGGREETTRVEGRSALAGELIDFRWNEDDDDYSASVMSSRYIDEELLRSLRVDTDLVAFLPTHPVREAAAWSVAPRALRDLMDPGGHVPLEDEDDEVLQDFFSLERVDELRGRLTAHYMGRCESDPRLAVIDLRGELTAETDPAEREGEIALVLGYCVPGTALDWATMDLEIEGRILWDLEADHVHALSLQANVQIEERSDGTAESGYLGVRRTWRWSGTLHIELSLDC